MNGEHKILMYQVPPPQDPKIGGKTLVKVEMYSILARKSAGFRRWVPQYGHFGPVARRSFELFGEEPTDESLSTQKFSDPNQLATDMPKA